MKFLKFRRGSKASSSYSLSASPTRQDEALYPSNSLLGLPLEIREQIWAELLPRKALIVCPCIRDEDAEPQWFMGNAGQCEPCYQRQHRYRSRSPGGGARIRVPPTNFDFGLLRVNRQIREEVQALAGRREAMATYHMCMQSCMRLLLASLPLQRKAEIRKVRLRHNKTNRPLEKTPRLEVFQGLKLPLDTGILSIDTRDRVIHEAASWVHLRTDMVFHWSVPGGVDRVSAIQDEILRGKEDERRRKKRDNLVQGRDEPGRPTGRSVLLRLGTLGAQSLV